jgi:uracil-DNA glycosylase
MTKTDGTSDLSELAGLVRAHLEWEREWTGVATLPFVDAPPRARQTNRVCARGNPAATLVFVGDGGGGAFVDEAGALLDKMIVAMGFSPNDTYVVHLVKGTSIANELDGTSPSVIVALGPDANAALGCSGTNERGSWSERNGVSVMTTHHPAFLLRTPAAKREAWEDLQKVMAKLSASATTKI